MDAERIVIYITYKSKTIAFSANPRNRLKVTINNIIRLSKADPQRFWELPKERWLLDSLYLGKWDENGCVIFYPFSDSGDSLCLLDFNIKERDKLVLIQRIKGFPYKLGDEVKSSFFKIECGHCKDITDWGIHKRRKKFFLYLLFRKKYKYYLVCESCYKNEIDISKKIFNFMSKTINKAKQYVDPEVSEENKKNESSVSDQQTLWIHWITVNKTMPAGFYFITRSTGKNQYTETFTVK